MRLTLRHRRGQALTEFALVAPFFFALVLALFIFGLWVFYNQQLENAAREAARYAAVHSTGAQCPTVSRLDPGANTANSYFRCDAPEGGWPRMTAAGQSKVWGMPASGVSIAACWSGFVDASGNANAMPTSPNVWADCTIGGRNPKADPNSISCPAPVTVPGSTNLKADGDDKSSSLAFYNGTHFPTTVTVYACYRWTPPLSGLLFVPQTITLRAVITEAMQRQQ
jgi:TadE-like protein